MHLSVLLWMTCPVLVWIQNGFCAQIRLEDNGYKGIVVAVDKSIVQVKNHFIYDAIQKLFNISSKYLYHSMRQRAYFSEITILLPPTWSSEEWMEEASSELYETADFKIVPSTFINEPHVDKMSSECGQGAKSIEIPDSFLTYVNSPSAFGGDDDPGRWLVKLWSQFRYGIYDEHGYANDKSYPYFYFDDEILIPMPTACSTADLFFGNVIDVRNGKECTNMNEIMFGGFCEYVLSHDYDQTNSSINYAHDFSPITQFCDDDKDNRHNNRAPTKQNANCFYRSTWSVIMEHDDFKSGRNLPREVLDPVPKIKMVYPSVRHFVLAFDYSDEEEINDKKGRWFQQALSKFIQYEISVGTSIGIVTFSDDAMVVFNITAIVTKDDKDMVISSLPTQLISGSNSCIGCGLSTSLKLLGDSNALKGGVIVVISSGHQSAQPTILDVYPELFEADVQINWISYGNFTGDELPDIVEQTRGQMYYAEAGVLRGVTTVASALFQITRFDQDQKVEMVMDETVVASDQQSPITGTFPIDQNIGRDTVFIVIYDEETAAPGINLTSPYTGQTWPSSRIDSSHENIVAITIPAAKAGLWSYSIAPGIPLQNISISVTSALLSEEAMSLTITGWTNAGFEMVNVTEKPIVLYGSVKYESHPVLRATVIARVTRPCGESVDVELLDIGADPDFQKFDGVYSRYFTAFCGRGHYGAQLMVNGKMSIRASYFQHSTTDYQRVVTCTSFSIINEDSSTSLDTLPPARILDLRASQNISSAGSQLALLEWTATGDDYDFGIADHYEMKFGNSIAMVRGQGFIENTQLVTNDMILSGSLIPLTAGSQQRVVVTLPASMRSYFVALAAVDEAGNMAIESNVVQVFFPEICDAAGKMFTDFINCSIYYVCTSAGSKPTPMTCPSGLCYDSTIDACVWP